MTSEGLAERPPSGHALASRMAKAQVGAVLDVGRAVVRAEARALEEISRTLSESFVRVVEAVESCEGHVVISGIGKSGFIAQKVSATLASLGIPSLFLHPSDAMHGDLGRVVSGDVAILMSYSGETEELLRLAPSLRRRGAVVVTVTASETSSLAKQADLALAIGIHEEAGHKLAPTTSTTALLAVGDALAMAVLERRTVTDDAFLELHPAGSIGRRLTPVGAVMRTGDMLPTVPSGSALADVISVMTRTRGRPGAALVVDAKGVLLGIYTDGDLRRQIERGAFSLNDPVDAVMCANPKSVGPDELVTEATRLLREHHIDQVPVVDAERKAIGLLDVQDLLAQRFL